MTIYAQASGRGRAGIAVFRVSGGNAGEALQALCAAPLPAPRVAALRTLRNPESATLVDRGLVIWFPGPNSFTGEDLAEIHIHGGPAVASALVDALDTVGGLRPAEPGEFTRRAFENGKMDLTAAEGIADLINAETEAQRAQAYRQMEGALGGLYEGWRNRLVQALAFAEAGLDFPDEDLPDSLVDQTRPELEALAGEIGAHLSDGRRGERLREGCQVVLSGPPNVGKSSLMNHLARRDVAIVSEIAGTTRDVIEVGLNLAGYPVTLVDTAGLREGGDAVEEEGVRRAKARAEAADLRIDLHDATCWGQGNPVLLRKRNDNTLVVVNKADLCSVAREDGIFVISAKTGDGVDDLLSAIMDRVITTMDVREAPSLTQARHRYALEQTLSELRRFLASDGEEPELLAENIRLAARALGRITGQVDVEEVLDAIFRDFCIGK